MVNRTAQMVHAVGGGHARDVKAAMQILVLNAGSSTLKFKLLKLRDRADDRPEVLVNGMVDKWGTPQAGLRTTVAGEATKREAVAAESPADAAEHAIRVCQPHGIDAIGH